MPETAHERASQSVSERFTRVMNATTSRWGMFTDPSIIGICVAPFAVGWLAAVRLDAAPGVALAFEVLTAAPLVVALALVVALRGARAQVVDWLASVPFPVENMNAVLNGLGEAVEIVFREGGPRPSTAELNLALDRVSPECFVTKGGEADAKPVTDPAHPEPPAMEVRIGVVDSTRNPSSSNHQRYERVRAIVREVLIPLAERHPVAEVRVK
jgi:hypothetical protein